MRYLREFCGVMVLTCVLALSTQAGEIHCPITEPTPPPPLAAGEIPCPVNEQPPPSATGQIECGIEAALDIIQNILLLA